MTDYNNPLVSIIITTKNSEQFIEDCLKSILKQTYKSLEVIIIDNFSTDKTKTKVTKFKKKFQLISYEFYQYGTERSAQRNYGLKKSKGKYFLYIDVDMTLSPELVKKCVSQCEKKQLDALYIPEMISGNSYWSKVRCFERSFYHGTVIDAVRFVKTSLAQKVRGFDESMSGPEDWDFDKKIRNTGHTSIIDSPIYHNESGFNLMKYLRKKKYYGKSFKQYIDKWGSNDPDVKKQFSPIYRLLIVFLEDDKWKKLIKHPILTLGMYFLRFLVGLQFILSLNKEW